MKLVVFLTYYDSYLVDFYYRNPFAASLPYTEQLNCILDDYFNWVHAVARRLPESDYTVEYIVANAEPLQHMWAKENNVEFNAIDWKFSIPYRQIQAYRPDLLLIGSMFEYYGEYLKALKQYCKKIFAWIACPMPSKLDMSCVDLILSSHLNIVNSLTKNGYQCEYLLPAFEPKILEHITNSAKFVDVSFIGSLTLLHKKRVKVIKTLLNKTPIQIAGQLHYKAPKVTGIRSFYYRLEYELNKLSLNNRYLGEVWGIEMYKLLSASKMTINVHIDIAKNTAGNIRMFESTGVGSMLITEMTPNINNLFLPGIEIQTYANINELIDIINYYLQNDEERSSIASKGQEKTLNLHNTIVRSMQFSEIIDRHIG